MPRMYRIMICNGDGNGPKVGAGRDMLGARPKVDVTLDPVTGFVVLRPHKKPPSGISVSESISTLPSVCAPARLEKFGVKGGTKPDVGQCIWVMGEGPYSEAAIGAALRLVVEGKPGHGFIGPQTHQMSLEDYQSALASTRSDWAPSPEDDQCPIRRRGTS